MGRRWRTTIVLTLALSAFAPVRAVRAQELSSKEVLDAIERAQKLLISLQSDDGSWGSPIGNRYGVGVSALTVLALLNSGMTMQDEPVRKAIEYLRSIREPEPQQTYEISLMISALAAAKDGPRDKPRILALAQKLENGQLVAGENAGSWSYTVESDNDRFRGDRSNGQFAVLGLREAAVAGISVDRKVWQRAREHWLKSQSPDGGWGYSGQHNPRSSGSMTAAGIGVLSITSDMLRNAKDLNADGTPACCVDEPPDEAMERALNWMESKFAVGTNPGSGTWLLYYLYGMERAGRLSGKRFFGEHDWYREGAEFLVTRQNLRTGSWIGVGPMESEPVVGTSLALLFLSKGLSPVVINKLMYGPVNPLDPDGGPIGNNWNKHRNDVRNLVEVITGLEKWPRLLTWQTVDIHKAVESGGVEDLLQAPICFIAGREAPILAPADIQLLKEYIDQGGFIFAVANCGSSAFDGGFRDLVRKLFPSGEAELKKLPPEHPVFRSEYLLEPNGIELWGVDFGCRTALIYSPDDLSCLWDKWAQQDPPHRTPEAKAMIERAKRIGVNVVAYATGRELLDKIARSDLATEDGAEDQVERGLLQIAKLRHSGNWDAAPQAIRHLLIALNEQVGLAASTKVNDLPPTDPDLFKYPLVYMHGRNNFQMSRQEREQLRLYLDRGGVLFADSCCGAPAFDQSFRELMKQLYPDVELQRISPQHEMFTAEVGHDLKTVRRRAPTADRKDAAIDAEMIVGEPFLEGIEINGRYSVIYSKYDISCALQRQASIACVGYAPDDAVKIAVNVVLYSLLQDVRFTGVPK